MKTITKEELQRIDDILGAQVHEIYLKYAISKEDYLNIRRRNKDEFITSYRNSSVTIRNPSTEE
jgi:hypothetical protein